MVWGCYWDHEWGVATCVVTLTSSAGTLIRSRRAFDDFRQGVSVRTNKQRYSGLLLRINSGQKDNNLRSSITGTISHEIEQSVFGQPPTIESEGTPYSDSDKFSPALYLQISKNAGVDFKSSTPEIDKFGAIEPLVIREAIKFESIDYPYFRNNIRASLQGGNEDIFLRSDSVMQFIPVSSSLKKDPFSDNVGHRGDLIAGSVELFITSSKGDDNTKIIHPFDDSRPETLFSGAPDADKLTSVSVVDNALRDMTGSKDNDFRPKGYKSSAAGYTYRNNTTIGTDSLAFGGLKR